MTLGVLAVVGAAFVPPRRPVERVEPSPVRDTGPYLTPHLAQGEWPREQRGCHYDGRPLHSGITCWPGPDVILGDPFRPMKGRHGCNCTPGDPLCSCL